MDASDPKILLATQDFPPTEGGIARVYADMVRGFPPGSFVVSTTQPVGPAGPPPAGVTIEYEPFPMVRAHRPASVLRWQRDLDRLLAGAAFGDPQKPPSGDPENSPVVRKPDLLICGNVRPLGPLCRRLARRHRIPYYVMVHGNDLLAARRHWSGLRAITWNRVFGDARRWIAASEAVRRIGTEEMNLSPERSAVILPEVDTRLFRPPSPGEKPELRRELGLPADGVMVIFIGRLVVRKGLDRLIEAMGEVAGGGGRAGGSPPWQLVVAGYGDPAPYRALAGKCGISDRVTFRTGVGEAGMRRLLRAADIAALPSRTIPEKGDIEGFGIVYLEAAASGLPVVAGNSGGSVEAVEDGVTGIVVDGDDPGAIRRAIEKLFGDPALQEQMGAAGRARAVEKFGPGSRAAQLLRIIEADFGRE